MEVAPEHEHLRRYSEILTQSSHFVAISNLLAYSADDLKKDYPSITYLDEACSLFSDVRVLEHDILALLCDYDPAVLENDIDKLCSITDRSGEVVEASTFLLNAAGTMAYNEVNDPEALKAFDCSVSSIRNYIDYVRATIEEQSLVS